jgi:hypothetical protein
LRKELVPARVHRRAFKIFINRDTAHALLEDIPK